jgi:hypothetical protein
MRVENCPGSNEFSSLKIIETLTILDIFLSVQKPVGDLVLAGVLHDRNDLFYLLFGELTSPLAKINVSLEKMAGMLILNVESSLTPTNSGCNRTCELHSTTYLYTTHINSFKNIFLCKLYNLRLRPQ